MWSLALLTTILTILPYWPKYCGPRSVSRSLSSCIDGLSPVTYTRFFWTTRSPARCFRLNESASFFCSSFCCAATLFFARAACFAFQAASLDSRQPSVNSTFSLYDSLFCAGFLEVDRGIVVWTSARRTESVHVVAHIVVAELTYLESVSRAGPRVRSPTGCVLGSHKDTV